MTTETMTADLANRLELAEADAWIDMYAAAPTDYREKFGLDVHRFGAATVLTSPGIPFGHFNSVFGLGLAEPATEQLVDDVLAVFTERSITSTFIHITPNSRPEQLPDWLASRGLRARSGWDRIHRGSEPPSPLASSTADGLGVERVTRETAPAWASYISTMYGLPTEPWLIAFAERPGWHHYMLRDGANILSVRSMYLHSNGVAWLGIDAPIPGIMAPTYDLDARVCRAIIEEGLRMGATDLIADIEASSPAMDTPAYTNFAALGFRRLYFRSNYSW